MGRFHSIDEVYSALFVDFDNIFARLTEQDPALARTFGSYPQRWLRWIESHALRMMYGDNVRRRILKKVCYLNPQRFLEFRPYFVRTGFHVVDCAAHSSNGRANTSVHVTLDCLDVLNHSVRYDEVILLSGDADLTPLLLRVQEHAKRSLVLAIGYTPPAFSAACSWRIREDWFITQALEESRFEDNEAPGGERVAEARHEEARDLRPAEHKALAPVEAPAPVAQRYAPAAHAPAPYTPAAHAPAAPAPAQYAPAHNAAPAAQPKRNVRQKEKTVELNIPVSRRIRLVEVIKQLVLESNVPIPLPSIAQVLQHEQESTPDWFGAGTLRELLDLLDLTPLAFSHAGQGFVYDPQRHEKPDNASIRTVFKQSHPELYDFALRVNQLTDAPMLKPELYAQVLQMLAEEVAVNGYSRKTTVQNIEDRCYDENVSVDAEQIGFILDAIAQGGVTLPPRAATVTVEALETALLERATQLCRQAMLPCGKDEMRLLQQWLTSQPVAPKPVRRRTTRP